MVCTYGRVVRESGRVASGAHGTLLIYHTPYELELPNENVSTMVSTGAVLGDVCGYCIALLMYKPITLIDLIGLVW